MRITKRTLIEGNFSYYNLFQHGYPGWFAYAPTTTPLSTAGSKTYSVTGERTRSRRCVALVNHFPAWI